ncbi:hypothetical protein NDU88_006040 [Pleurodeles waltl]|uniref:Uncharacterized protein n=1 Tax=Pleurodeles waltl TaxID=8319 RepID=A0AAV7LZ14_PLEWA|nr:hypothetical protein NDU88_006040 [Pleurodeles waltl]
MADAREAHNKTPLDGTLIPPQGQCHQSDAQHRLRSPRTCLASAGAPPLASRDASVCLRSNNSQQAEISSPRGLLTLIAPTPLASSTALPIRKVSAATCNQCRPEASTILRSRSGPPLGAPPLLSRVQLVPPQRVSGALEPRAHERAPAPSHRFQALADRLWLTQPDSSRGLTLTPGPIGALRWPNLLPCCLGIGRSPREFESSGVAHRIVKDLMVADRAPLKRGHLSARHAPPSPF